MSIYKVINNFVLYNVFVKLKYMKIVQKWSGIKPSKFWLVTLLKWKNTIFVIS